METQNLEATTGKQTRRKDPKRQASPRPGRTQPKLFEAKLDPDAKEEENMREALKEMKETKEVQQKLEYLNLLRERTLEPPGEREYSGVPQYCQRLSLGVQGPDTK
jgi:hypothetical protein